MSNAVNLIVNTSVAVNLPASLVISDPNPANLFGGVVAALGNVTGTAGEDSVGITALDAAYVVYDPAHHPGNFTVSQVGSAALPGTKFIYTGPGSAGGRSTFVISACGDKDGDGINDICIYVNSATSDPVNKPLAGTTFVVPGGHYLQTSPVIDLNDSTPVVAGKYIVRIEGAAAGNFAGQSLANGGNWDGSGYAITFIGAPGYGPLMNGLPAGAFYGVPGGPNFFGTRLYDLANINSFGAIFTRSNSTGDNGYFLGSVFPGSGTIRLGGDYNHSGLPSLIVGDPTAQNKTPNTQRVRVFFGNRNARGTFFVEDMGKTFGGATLYVDTINACHLTDPIPCYGANDFGATVAGRDGSLMAASPTGVLNGQVTQGEVFVSTQPVTNGQVINVQSAVQNLQGATLWDLDPLSSNPLQEDMGMTLIDGADARLIGMPGFDNNRGKLLFTSVALPGGNVDVATTTIFSLTGETQGDALTYGGGLDRSQDGSILVGARSFTNDPQGGKFYYIPRANILF